MLDAQLSRGYLGGPKYDAILDSVLARTASRPAWRLRWALGTGMALASVAGAWLVLARPSSPTRVANATKGPSGAALAALDIGCTGSGGPGRVCPVGGTLMFMVNAALVTGYLGAYSERASDPTHERIWYFPTAAGRAPFAKAGPGTIVLPEGILIGPEHRPGRYEVTVWISDHPVDRSRIEQADPAVKGEIRDRTTFEIDVVP
jgi:hypothetical protein